MSSSVVRHPDRFTAVVLSVAFVMTGVLRFPVVGVAAQGTRTARLPRVIKRVEPVYPADVPSLTRRAVEIQVTVGTDGRVSDARVVRSMPPFDQAALEAVRQWLFDSARLTKPVTGSVVVILTPPPAPRAAGRGVAGSPSSAARTPETPVTTSSESPDAAIRRLTQALTTGSLSDPARVQALRQRGLLYATTGRVGLAEKDLAAVLSVDGRDADAHFARGLAHFAGSPTTTIRAFSEAIAGAPGRTDAYRGRAWARLVAGDFSDAVSDFDQVVRRDPDSEAFRGRGWAQFHLKRYERAVADFTEVLRLAPLDSEAHVARGLAQSFEGRRKEARADFMSSMRIRPIRNGAHAYNSVRLDDFQRYTRVLTPLTETTRRNANDVDAWLAVGVVGYRQFDDRVSGGSLRVASRSRPQGGFDRAVAVAPTDLDARMFRATFHAAPYVAFDREAAIADFSEVIRLDPQHMEAYMRRALVLASDAATLPAAVADIEQALRLLPGDPLLTRIADKLKQDLRTAELARQKRAIQAQVRAAQAEELAAALLGIVAAAAVVGPGPSGIGKGAEAAYEANMDFLRDRPCRTSAGRPC